MALSGALAIVTTACVVFVLQAAAAVSEPRVALVSRAPVTLAGTGFATNDRVVVTVRAPGTTVRKELRADARGRFRTTVSRIALTGALRCATGVTIVARARSGRLALWAPPRLPDCPSPLEPPA
jgi:hypothetical protein